MEDNVINEDTHCDHKNEKSFVVVTDRVDHESKSKMGNGHEATIETSTLGISETLMHAGWAGLWGRLRSSDSCS